MDEDLRYKIKVNALLSIAMMLIVGRSFAQTAVCGVQTGFLHTPHSEYRGTYRNSSYRYSVRIPDDLVGYDQPDPANHHGFGIAVGPLPKDAIFVNGEKNPLEYEQPPE